MFPSLQVGDIFNQLSNFGKGSSSPLLQMQWEKWKDKLRANLKENVLKSIAIRSRIYRQSKVKEQAIVNSSADY